ncbi:33 kDa chaperonin [Arenicella chitinivorans]|uniref:33 kDa chaperonin n=1 Tax=Arenicella chitinivorans TaxID=1329800 RepID=A0A918VS64_9GAMM|nr:Hsp33 family molecular chaperone HslO [Arenicella chitinivorans]GHA19781.1 33 kDa chaperonin [Arenicella chitinivorans]
MSDTDFRQRFVFDKLDVRGCIVRLDKTSQTIQDTHHYPPHLAHTLNEFALAATLLRDSIKVPGGVTIQLRTAGAISLMMADCMADRRVRAIAEYTSENLPADSAIHLNEMGNGSTLAITITPEEGERYQSIVPIEQPTLSQCLEDYFARSEQLPSLFQFFTDGHVALGIALHALPQEKVRDAALSVEHFSRLEMLLSSLTQKEALTLSSEDILRRLFHEEACRLFDTYPVEFGCVCSAQKSLDAVAALGEEDVRALIQEQQDAGHPALVVDCHFCFQRYELDFNDLTNLFTS